MTAPVRTMQQSRNVGADGHDIRECCVCGELYCVFCSDTDNNRAYCSPECEHHVEREQ